MPTFASDGVTLAFADEGEGKPVLLIHGYASNAATNWAATSWFTTITRSGRRVVAIDNRGHGASEKLYDPAQYRTETMAADAVRLLDRLGIERAAVMGYSMGARIAAFMALAAPERITALVLSGLAANLIHGVRGGAEIAAAMEAPTLEAVADPGARAFRVFADQTRSDRAALAACIRVSRTTLTEDEARSIAVPTLVVAGENDTVSGPADVLADLIPGARAVTLPGRDHMSAVGDRTHKAEVLAFLDAAGA